MPRNNRPSFLKKQKEEQRRARAAAKREERRARKQGGDRNHLEESIEVSPETTDESAVGEETLDEPR